MPRASITIESPIRPTPRVLQLRGLFDLAETKTSRLSWEVDLPIDERDWNVGLIVGVSGSGKSTIAREFWPRQIARRYRWPKDASVVDAFPDLPMREITELLSSVGFSSPPAWLRPFHALSTGEQFRATIARVLAEQPDLAVIDEFTSVVDRTVAQIGSAAIAKTVRRRGQRIVAVTCHEDVEEWLQPDWVYRPATADFSWGCLQRRPAIELDVCRVDGKAVWPLFRPHHYLDGGLNPSAVCFAAYWRDRPVAFAAWLADAGRRGRRRLSRSVCLPDYQGVGIGAALNAHTAAMWKALGIRPSIASTHPAVISSMNRSSSWAMTRLPARARRQGHTTSISGELKHATRRRTASFEYVGPPLDRVQAERLRAG